MPNIKLSQSIYDRLKRQSVRSGIPMAQLVAEHVRKMEVKKLEKKEEEFDECDECGAKVLKDSLFCSQCGVEFEEDEEEEEEEE